MPHVEDDAIAEIVKFQEDVGLQSVTDGEFRRTYAGAGAAGDARHRQGEARQGHPEGRLRLFEVEGERRPHDQGDDPVANDAALSRQPRRHQQGHYLALVPFYQDVADAYGVELRSLAAAGCSYVQMDDTHLAYLCDDKMREAALP